MQDVEIVRDERGTVVAATAAGVDVHPGAVVKFVDWNGTSRGWLKVQGIQESEVYGPVAVGLHYPRKDPRARDCLGFRAIPVALVARAAGIRLKPARRRKKR